MIEEFRLWQNTDSDSQEAVCSPAVARVLEIPEPGGQLLVKMEGHQPVLARVTAEIAGQPVESLLGSDVVLLFEGGDSQRPIAIAALHNGRVGKDPEIENEQESMEALVDGEKVLIKARQRIELRCGKGSIVIDSSGKITVRGSHLLSRSSGAVRIKGGHVDIN